MLMLFNLILFIILCLIVNVKFSVYTCTFSFHPQKEEGASSRPRTGSQQQAASSRPRTGSQQQAATLKRDFNIAN